MKLKLTTKNSRRFTGTSKYNVKLYKKYLSFKILTKKEDTPPNLVVSKDASIPIKFVKCIYTRKELIPFRVLRFFHLLNDDVYKAMGVKFLVSRKLSVYNGKRSKFINVHKGLLEVTIRCSFKFGDLIFTRARYKFKKKKKKKKK